MPRAFWIRVGDIVRTGQWSLKRLEKPAAMARTQCWWWWLNGNVTKEGITRDLEEMKAKGIGGPNIVDAGGADQRGHRQVPHGPDFGSREWRELFVHALSRGRSAGARSGFQHSERLESGRADGLAGARGQEVDLGRNDCGGRRARRLRLPQPRTTGDFYRDVAVLAIRTSSAEGNKNPLQISADSSQKDYPRGAGSRRRSQHVLGFGVRINRAKAPAWNGRSC